MADLGGYFDSDEWILDNDDDYSLSEDYDTSDMFTSDPDASFWESNDDQLKADFFDWSDDDDDFGIEDFLNEYKAMELDESEDDGFSLSGSAMDRLLDAGIAGLSQYLAQQNRKKTKTRSGGGGGRPRPVEAVVKANTVGTRKKG